MLMGLGVNIEKIMKARGLSYPAVARGAGIEDPQTVWALVDRKSKKSQFANHLANFFGVRLDRLVADDFDVSEASTEAPKEDRVNTVRARSDGDDLLVLIRAFLDSDAARREALIKAAYTAQEANARTRSTKRRKPK